MRNIAAVVAIVLGGMGPVGKMGKKEAMAPIQPRQMTVRGSGQEVFGRHQRIINATNTTFGTTGPTNSTRNEGQILYEGQCPDH